MNLQEFHVFLKGDDEPFNFEGESAQEAYDAVKYAYDVSADWTEPITSHIGLIVEFRLDSISALTYKEVSE